MDINQEITKKEASQLYKENKGRIGVDDDSFVSLSHVNKIYASSNKAVTDFNLKIKQGEFVALVGPSGCGKSTTLRMIAGLEDITSGELYINGILSNYVPSKDRDIAMVFQSYALYPQLSVYDNIAFGLKIRKIDKDIIKEKVFEAAKILDLGEYLDRKPKELSGGQMQRVALGRAIVRDAKLFLMDEPLSNLDAKLRVSMRGEIVRIHETLKATTIYVTHDQTEAMTMANKIVVMNKGFIQQIGEPMDIYNDPANLFVATFIGSPAMNLFKVSYQDGNLAFNNGYQVSCLENIKEAHNSFYSKKIQEINDMVKNYDSFNKTDLEDYVAKQYSHLNLDNSKEQEMKHVEKKNLWTKFTQLFKHKKKDSINEEVIDQTHQTLEKLLSEYQQAMLSNHDMYLGIRCEDIHIANEDETDALNFTVSQIEVLGSEFILYGNIDSYDVRIKVQGQCKIAPHSVIKVKIDLQKAHLFDLNCGTNIEKD